MKYQYKFGTGYESVEVDEEWMAVLREFDRVERNANERQRYHTACHIEAFEFVPDFMGTEEKGYETVTEDLASVFDGSPYRFAGHARRG